MSRLTDKRSECTGRCFAIKTAVAMFKGTFNMLGNKLYYVYYSNVSVLSMEPKQSVKDVWMGQKTEDFQTAD